MSSLIDRTARDVPPSSEVAPQPDPYRATEHYSVRAEVVTSVGRFTVVRVADARVPDKVGTYDVIQTVHAPGAVRDGRRELVRDGFASPDEAERFAREKHEAETKAAAEREERMREANRREARERSEAKERRSAAQRQEQQARTLAWARGVLAEEKERVERLEKAQRIVQEAEAAQGRGT